MCVYVRQYQILFMLCSNFFSPDLLIINIFNFNVLFMLGDVLGIYRNNGFFYLNKFVSCAGAKKISTTICGLPSSMRVGYSVKVLPDPQICGHPYFSAEVEI